MTEQSCPGLGSMDWTWPNILRTTVSKPVSSYVIWSVQVLWPYLVQPPPSLPTMSSRWQSLCMFLSWRRDGIIISKDLHTASGKYMMYKTDIDLMMMNEVANKQAYQISKLVNSTSKLMITFLVFFSVFILTPPFSVKHLLTSLPRWAGDHL